MMEWKEGCKDNGCVGRSKEFGVEDVEHNRVECHFLGEGMFDIHLTKTIAVEF